MHDDPDDPVAKPPTTGRARPPARAQPVAAGPAPDAGRLREAALAHLARFAASESGLIRVLDRRILRWTRRAQVENEAWPADEAAIAADRIAAAGMAARDAARAVAKSLVTAGVLDDAAYAEARTRSLARAGRSRRAIGAHLAERGVAQAVAAAALSGSEGAGVEAAGDPEAIELAAALSQARRRRIGPFSRDPAADADPVAQQRALAALARAGFDRDIAERALSMEPEEAESRILALKRL